MPDTAEFARLHAASFTTPRPWSEAEIVSLLSSPLVFVCAESGGFLMGRVIAGEAELLTLAVDPLERRKGIGRRLVAAFLEQAAKRNAEQALLEVAATNSAAIDLYLSAGFAPTGLRKAYYSDPNGTAIDAKIMARPI
ncbi:GNAT family N-acetyltransferase [Thioclava sp. FR2]|uniref:GNAT family N-acetyltransferase n=1 Tax=Thioclava sp. FR2 TaxID=3445780 RepID=UPI003EBAB733